jgi:molybdopterin-guanine dinucleotide biosynthesis protein A
MRPATRRQVTGVVLAGGRASRLGGGAKGLERVGGARIVDRVAAALRASSDALLLAASPPDAPTWLPGVPVVPDALAGHGPLGGIHAALAHAGGPVLVVAWDMPFVPAALLVDLRALGERAGADAAVPGAPAGGAPDDVEPLCAYYDVGCLAPIERRLAAGARSLRGLLDDVCVARLDAARVAAHGDPAVLFANVNTPDDLERARRLAGGR